MWGRADDAACPRARRPGPPRGRPGGHSTVTPGTQRTARSLRPCRHVSFRQRGTGRGDGERPMKKAARAFAVWRVLREAQRPGTPGVLSRVRAIPRMLRGALRGDYPHLSASKIGMLGLALAYILSPIDLVPEFLAVIGAVDDFGVLLWLLAALLGESGRYLE